MVRDKEGNFRGYAFIEFENEGSVRNAYSDADGIKILGRRIVVDVERGRTVRDWCPRRLGMKHFIEFIPSSIVHTYIYIAATDPTFNI